MSFVKTQEELDSYYGLGVRHFPGAQMLGVMFMADGEVTARLLPPPLEQAPNPGGLMFIAEYPDTNLGPGYREGALFLRCVYDGVPGNYCLSMPITSEPRMHNGRDIFGFPKKMANIHLVREGKTAHGWVERYGVTFVEITVELTGSLPALPPTGPTYLFKGMPRIDLQPGFDGPVFLAKQQTVVEMVSCEIGTAQVTLTPAEHDPWAELGDIQPMIAFMLESNNTMHPGEIIREVDPMAYLPHYFHFTDFSAGKSEE